ncbi:MAG: sulfite exporter TauE/SafE family protein [Chloroflexota bacterium]
MIPRSFLISRAPIISQMEFYVVLILVALLVGLSKGGMGAVLGVLVTPLLSLIMPVPTAISLALPLLMIGDVFGLYFYWKTWDMHYVRLLLPVAIVGVLAGTYLLKTLDAVTLRHILAGFTLLFVAYKAADKWLKALDYHPRNWHGYVAGAASGLGSALANAGSVPFTAYMLLQDVTPEVFAGTTTIYFAIINALKVPPFISAGLIDLDSLVRVAWVLPFIPVGVYAARWIVKRIDQRAFEWVMLVVLVIAAAGLIFI